MECPACGRLSDDLKTPHRIEESLDMSAPSEDAILEVRDLIEADIRFNSVVETGVPGFVPGRH